MAHRRIGQEAFRFDAKAEHQTSLDALAGLDRLAGGGSVRVTGNRGHQRKGNTSSRGRPHWANAIENDLAPRRLPPRKILYVLMPLPANVPRPCALHARVSAKPKSGSDRRQTLLETDALSQKRHRTKLLRNSPLRAGGFTALKEQ
jgi:hypothetical protein